MSSLALATAILVSHAGTPAPADTSRAVIVARIDGSAALTAGLEALEAVEVGADGSIYALDGSTNALHAFDAGGRHRWSVGRRGRGPGEFESPVGLAWAPDGRLWVIDPGNQRATVIGQDGRIVGTRVLPSSFVLSPWPGRFDREGRLLHYAAPDNAGYEYQIAVFDQALTRGVTRRPPEPPEPIAHFQGVTDRGSDMRTPVPFTPRLVWRLDQQGRFVSAWTAELAFSRDGQPLGGPEFPREPGPPVTEVERRAAVEGLSRFVRLGGRIDPARIPARKPVLSTFVLDERDRIWAMMSRVSGETGTRFEVLSATGTHQRTVLVPARLDPFPTIVVRGDLIVGVERDEDGVETIMVARVR